MSYADGDSRDDQDVWRSVQAGDRDAFAVVYRRHVDAVRSHARRLTGCPTAAEDVVAATFLTAWRRCGEASLSTVALRPWLLGVAANEARSEWRRSMRFRRLAERLGPPAEVADHAEGVARALDDRRLAVRAVAAVDLLSAAQRDAVSLCLVAEKSYTDAARELGVTEVTLRLRVHRARARLRTLLATADR